MEIDICIFPSSSVWYLQSLPDKYHQCPLPFCPMENNNHRNTKNWINTWPMSACIRVISSHVWFNQRCNFSIGMCCQLVFFYISMLYIYTHSGYLPCVPFLFLHLSSDPKKHTHKAFNVTHRHIHTAVYIMSVPAVVTHRVDGIITSLGLWFEELILKRNRETERERQRETQREREIEIDRETERER